MTSKTTNEPTELQEPTDLPENFPSREYDPDPDMTPTLDVIEAPMAPDSLTIHEAPVIGSLVLSRLEKERRPNPSTVCEFCPASVWMASAKEVKCYCRIMHVISWISSEPNPLKDCDGLLIATQQ